VANKAHSSLTAKIETLKTHLRYGQHVLAENKIRQLDPKELAPYPKLLSDYLQIQGLINESKNDHLGAVKHYSLSIKLDCNTAIIDNLLTACIKTGSFRQAIETIKTHAPKSAIADSHLLKLAHCYHMLGDADVAKSLIESVLIKDPLNPVALALKSELLLADYKFYDAKQAILLINENEEHLNSKLKLLGQYYSGIREFKKAEEIYEKLARRVETNSIFEINLGVVFHSQGQYKKAKDHFRQALQLILDEGIAQRLKPHTPKSKTEVIETLEHIHSTFSKLNIPFFLVAGTFLGIYRDGSLIKGDKDIDIAVPWDVPRKKLLDLLAPFGFLSLPLTDSEPLWCAPVVDKNTKVSVDIFFAKNAESHIELGVDYTPPLVWSLPKFKLTKVKYNNREYLAPDPAEQYLEAFYGSGWNTPSSYCAVLRGNALKNREHEGSLAFGYYRLAKLIQSGDYPKALKYLTQIEDKTNDLLLRKLKTALDQIK